MKYFFFDIDGTLAVGSTGIIPENTKKAIKLLQKNGHFVAIATGRLYINATIIVQKCLKNFTNKKRNIYAKFLI